MPLVIPNQFANAGLNTPTPQLDADFQAIATYLNARSLLVGTIGARPAPGNAGAMYVASDQNYLFYVDDGAAWQVLGALRAFRSFPGQVLASVPAPPAGSLRLMAQASSGGTTPLVMQDSAAQYYNLPTSYEDITAGGSPVIDVVNNAAEVSAWTKTLRGGQLGTARKLHLWFVLDFLNNTGASRGTTLKFKLGGTLMLTLALAGQFLTNATRRQLEFSVLIANLATTAQVVYGLAYSGIQVGVSGAQAISGVDVAASAWYVFLGAFIGATVDTTVDQTMDFTVTNEVASASLSTRLLAQTSMLVF